MESCHICSQVSEDKTNIKHVLREAWIQNNCRRTTNKDFIVSSTCNHQVLPGGVVTIVVTLFLFPLEALTTVAPTVIPCCTTWRALVVVICTVAVTIGTIAILASWLLLLLRILTAAIAIRSRSNSLRNYCSSRLVRRWWWFFIMWWSSTGPASMLGNRTWWWRLGRFIFGIWSIVCLWLITSGRHLSFWFDWSFLLWGFIISFWDWSFLTCAFRCIRRVGDIISTCWFGWSWLTTFFATLLGWTWCMWWKIRFLKLQWKQNKTNCKLLSTTICRLQASHFSWLLHISSNCKTVLLFFLFFMHI